MTPAETQKRSDEEPGENGRLDLSALEREILSRIQHGFPVEAAPYDALAADLGVSAQQAQDAVSGLRDGGIIRRLGGSFSADELGYVSVLVAAEVSREHLEAVAACASRFPEVTHNYERSDRFNLWFTVIAESAERLEEIVDTIRRQPGAVRVEALPALRTFKLKVDFDLS